MQYTLVRLLAAAAVTGGARGILETGVAWQVEPGEWKVTQGSDGYAELYLTFNSSKGDGKMFTLISVRPYQQDVDLKAHIGHVPFQTFGFSGFKAEVCQNATNPTAVPAELCQNATKPTAVPATTCGKDKAGLDDLDGGGTALVILLGLGLALSLALLAWRLHLDKDDDGTPAGTPAGVSKMLL